MKKTTINIQHEANITAKGTHTQKNNKSVICLETGEVWASVLDTADGIGCSPSNLINHLQGKQRSCKGKHYCYLSRVNESLDAIVTRLRETSAIEEDAKKWQAYKAEQDAIAKAEAKRLEEARKAEEKRQAEIAKLQEKRANLNAKAEEYNNKWNETVSAIVEVEMALEALGVTMDENEAA